MKNKMLDSSKFVVDNAEHTSINWGEVDLFVDNFVPKKKFYWLKASPFDIEALSNEQKLMLITIFSSLSFSFWGEPYWNVKYKGTLHTRGSWSLIACIFRSIEEGTSLLDAEYIANITDKELNHILRGNTQIPLLQERVSILNKVGQTLQEKYDGKMLNLIHSNNESALELVDLIINEFNPSFNDSYQYKGETIFFNKKAQLLVESAHSLFESSDYLSITGSEELTALADYIIPNLLRSLSILNYSQELKTKIDDMTEIESGSKEEIEIRASVLWIIESMRKKLVERGTSVSALSINDYLWSIGADVKTPFHRTRTTAY